MHAGSPETAAAHHPPDDRPVKVRVRFERTVLVEGEMMLSLAAIQAHAEESEHGDVAPDAYELHKYLAGLDPEQLPEQLVRSTAGYGERTWGQFDADLEYAAEFAVEQFGDTMPWSCKVTDIELGAAAGGDDDKSGTDEYRSGPAWRFGV